jgi:hypothetical protein
LHQLWASHQLHHWSNHTLIGAHFLPFGPHDVPVSTTTAVMSSVSPLTERTQFFQQVRDRFSLPRAPHRFSSPTIASTPVFISFHRFLPWVANSDFILST